MRAKSWLKGVCVAAVAALVQVPGSAAEGNGCSGAAAIAVHVSAPVRQNEDLRAVPYEKAVSNMTPAQQARLYEDLSHWLGAYLDAGHAAGCDIKAVKAKLDRREALSGEELVRLFELSAAAEPDGK